MCCTKAARKEQRAKTNIKKIIKVEKNKKNKKKDLTGEYLSGRITPEPFLRNIRSVTEVKGEHLIKEDTINKYLNWQVKVGNGGEQNGNHKYINKGFTHLISVFAYFFILVGS